MSFLDETDRQTNKHRERETDRRADIRAYRQSTNNIRGKERNILRYIQTFDLKKIFFFFNPVIKYNQRKLES